MGDAVRNPGLCVRACAVVICGMLLLGAAACSDRAAELFETARFEELQNNREHARQLYEEIIRNYPESDYAKKARERLSDLQKTRQAS